MKTARRCRIVHVVGTLGGGGVQRLILAMAAAPALAAFSHTVVCVEHAEGELRESFQSAGIEVEPCPILWPASVNIGSYRASKWIRQRLASTFSWRLGRTIRALEATIVHSHISERIDQQAEAAIGAAHVPWIWTIHGLYQPTGRVLDRWKRATRTLDRGRGRVTAVSTAIVSDLEARGVRPRNGTVVIHPGVDLRPFSAARRRSADLRARLKIPDDVIVIGTSGRLVPEKAYEVLVAATELLVGKHLPIRVLIAGEGKLRSMLLAEIRRRGLEESVILLGYQSDVPGFLSNLDVYVQPSRSEGFSISLLEALAAGLPCVATSVGGMPELLAGDTGVLIPAEDIRSLAAALEGLCSRSVRATVAQNATVVAARHSINVTAQQWADLYNEVRNGGDGSRAT